MLPKKTQIFFQKQLRACACVYVYVVCLCARACVFLCVFVLCVRAYFTCVQTWSFCLDVNEIMHACMHNYGFSRYIGSLPKKMVCTVDGKTATQKLAGCCKKNTDPGVSCKAILAEFPDSETGKYFVKKEQNGANGAAMPVYCNMKVNGGGWSMVAKVSNSDGNRFYGRGGSSPMQTGQQFNVASMLDPTQEIDAIGEQYKQVKGSDLMILDVNNDEFVSGTFGGVQTLHNRIKNLGGNVGGPVRCVATGTSIKQSGGKVGQISVVGLGLKCEDDNEPNWRCNDDAVYIGWGGDASHRNGISKCGTDGGSDIYAGGNAQSQGTVTVWIR